MTNPMFALGEIAILAVATTDLSRVGEEREIRGLPAPIKQVSESGRLYGPNTYSVRNAAGNYFQAYEWQLKKRRPLLRCPGVRHVANEHRSGGPQR
jgi:hypothetical protein